MARGTLRVSQPVPWVPRSQALNPGWALADWTAAECLGPGAGTMHHSPPHHRHHRRIHAPEARLPSVAAALLPPLVPLHLRMRQVLLG